MSEYTDERLAQAAARGGVWGVAAEASTRASQSVCFFVLAGVLSPRQFGAAAAAFLCVQVANSLTYAGLGAAVQVLGPDVRRDRAALGMAVGLGSVGALALLLLAAPLCDLLGTPEATDLVRLVALTLPLAQTSEVMSSLLDRELRFRTTGAVVVGASVVSAVAGLSLAAAGVGAAALVAQGVIQPGARLIGVVIARPSLLVPTLHRAEVAQLWATGRDLLISQAFATAASNVDNIVVSVVAGAAALGGYGFAFNLTTLPFFLVGLAVGRVALPVYAQLHARSQSVLPAFLTANEVTGWLAALPLGYLAIAGPEALVVVFGHKWDPFAWALRVLALQGFCRTIETTSGAVLISLGKASVMRRVQQGQLAAVLVLLVPLVLAEGPVGAAIAVAVVILGGTTYSLRQAALLTGAVPLALARRAVEAAIGGVAGGAAGLATLQLLPSQALGLAASLLAAVLAWLVTMHLARPHLLRLARQTLRADTSVPEEVRPLLAAPVAVEQRAWESSLQLDLDERYSYARVLVSRHDHPAAWIGLPLDSGHASDTAVREAALDACPGLELLPASPAPPTGEVCVIVCTIGRRELLTQALTSLLACDHPRFEVLVVDNRPDDPATRETVASFDDPRLRMVVEPLPGLSFARNRGIAESTAPFLAFTDDDAHVDPGWIRWLTAALVSGEATVTTGLVLPLELETTAQLHFEGYGGFARGMERRQFDLKKNRADDHLVYPFSGGSFGSGNSMAFTRDALARIGGFDEALGAGAVTGGGEDIDAFTHLVLVGDTLVYDPRAVCWHVHRRDDEALNAQVYSYGTGFGAVLVKWTLKSGRLRRGLLLKVLTLLQALRPGRPTAARDRDAPPELSVLELKGMLASPRLYARARRNARRARAAGRRGSH